jgi:hypothetical protein
MARILQEVNPGVMVDKGNTRQVPNWEMPVQIVYLNDAGQRIVRDLAPNFPVYVLNNMPANRYKEYMSDMMIEIVRVKAGAEDWPAGYDTVNILGQPLP